VLGFAVKHIAQPRLFMIIIESVRGKN